MIYACIGVGMFVGIVVWIKMGIYAHEQASRENFWRWSMIWTTDDKPWISKFESVLLGPIVFVVQWANHGFGFKPIPEEAYELYGRKEPIDKIAFYETSALKEISYRRQRKGGGK